MTELEEKLDHHQMSVVELSAIGGLPMGKRGFGSMSPEKQREIASKGGKAAHEQGKAHEFDKEEAAAAGRKGGKIVSRDKSHMARIGRMGGQAKNRNRAEPKSD